MTRLLIVSGALSISMGAALLIPFVAAGGDDATSSKTSIVLSLAATLILGGLMFLFRGSRMPPAPPLPPPVRAALLGNILFLAFIALEFSDGVIRQGGRAFYWTSVLFLPSLLLFYGLVFARRWAWYVTRAVTALFTLWFVGFMALIPFADLRTDGVPVPWWGRLYMAGVSLFFAGIAAYTFHALGSAEAKGYFDGGTNND